MKTLFNLFQFLAGLVAKNPTALSADVQALRDQKATLQANIAKARQDRAAVIVLMTKEIGDLDAVATSAQSL